MTTIILDGFSSFGPWTVPGDFTASGHTVELLGAGGQGGNSSPGSSGVPGTGGGGGAYQKLTYSSGTIPATIDFSMSAPNSSTSDQDTTASIWQANGSITNAYRAQAGLAGTNTTTAPAGGLGTSNTNGSPPIVYTVSGSASGGSGGAVTSGGSGHGGSGGGGSAGPTGAGKNGGAGSTVANGSGGGGGGSNGGSSTAGSAATSTPNLGGNGGQGTSGSGQGTAVAGSNGNNGSTGGGGGGGTGIGSGSGSTVGGDGGTLGNVSNWTQTGGSTYGVGGGGGGGGGFASNSGSSTGGTAVYGGGGGGSGSNTAATTTGSGGGGGNGLIVITYTAAATQTWTITDDGNATGTNSATVSGLNIPAGSLIIVGSFAVTDTNYGTFSDSAGNTYQYLAGIITDGSSAAGIVYCYNSLALSSGSITFTPTLGGACGIWVLHTSNALNTADPTVAFQRNSGTSAAPSSGSISASPHTNVLYVGQCATHPSGAPFTQPSGYTATSLAAPTGGAARGGWHVDAGNNSQTYNPTLGSSQNWMAVLGSFLPRPTPPVTSATGAAAGSGTAAATARTVLGRNAAASGVGVAAAPSLTFQSRTAAATGQGAAAAQGQSFGADAVQAFGSGVASGVGAAIGFDAVQAFGQGTAAAQGSQIVQTNARASGAGICAATGTNIIQINAAAIGAGIANASGSNVLQTNAAAVGNGIAAASTIAITGIIASASGLGTATASGSVVVGITGLCKGQGTAAAFTFYFATTASTLVPDLDNIDGSWTNETGGTTLTPSISENTPSDADYIKSSNSPTSDTCKVRLSDPLAGIQEPMSVFYRFRAQGPGSINLRVRLMEGTTQITSWTHSGVGQNFLTVEQQLSHAEFISIVDPTNLFLEFQATSP